MAITAQCEQFAVATTSLIYEHFGITSDACSSENRAKSERDIGYHFTYLAEALWAEDPALFTNYTSWANALFLNLGFSADVLPTSLSLMQKVLEWTLPPEYAVLSRDYLALGAQMVHEECLSTTSYLEHDSPLAPLASAYLNLLLHGQRHDAVQLVLDAVKQGVSVRDIYLDVFQQTQREIGRLWQTNQISVAQEHYCTAVTQFTMSQLYPYIFTSTRSNRQLVATSVGGEMHEIGIRMVADFFELHGWDTYYLGANTPTESVVQSVVDNQADLVAISATLTPHIQQVAELIAAIRAASPQSRVLVGGYPFNISPNLWRKVGADATASDALAAVTIGEQLLA